MSASVQELSPMDRYRSALKSHSLKATPQRLAVHEAMLSLGHASADQVCAWLRSRGTEKVTASSVYNILSQMALLGIYGHRLSANSKMYFDVNTFKHIHLYDAVNNDYKDVIDDDLLEMVEAKIKSKKFRGYKVEGVDIQIICHPTAKKISTQKI